MEEVFPFPLWVEGDWNPGVLKLKNKLNIYFQSSKSNGGDCLVEFRESDGQRALVRFKTQDVRQRVLEKQRHELKFGKGVLRLTVVLPPSEEKFCSLPGTSGEISSLPSDGLSNMFDGGNGKGASSQTQEETMETDAVQEEAVAEADVETVSVLLEDVPEEMSREMVEMLVENISDTCAEREDFSLEIIPDISVAVVSFKNSKNASQFLSVCSSSKTFKKKNLSVRPLEVTKSVKVDKIPPNVSTEYLQLYFEREGKGEVDEAIKLEDEETALITFRHPKGVNEVLKKMHCIQKMTVGVYPYYKSLGTALYGKERPALKLPDSFTQSMDPVVWKFLRDKQLMEEINDTMALNFCKAELQSPAVLISPLPSLLKQRGLMTKDIVGWKEKAITTLQGAVAKFQSFECKVTPAVWKESETEICGALTEAVVIVPDMARGVVAIAGLAEDVYKLADVLEDSVGAATRKFERQRDSITAEVPLAPSSYHILREEGLTQKIAADCPELEMTYIQEGQKMILRGLSAEVYPAKSTVLEQIVALKRKVVEVEENLLALLREVDKEELCNSLFTAVGIKATYETDDRRVQLIAATDRALCDAEERLKTALGSYIIMVEDQSVLRKTEWEDLVTHLIGSFNFPLRAVTVRRIGNDTKQEVVVSGFQDSVNEVRQKLLNFISNNTIDEITTEIKSRATLKFIVDHKRETFSEAIEKDVRVKFNYDNRRPSITLRGPRAHLIEFKNSLQNVISSVHFDTLKIAEPGAKQFFKEKQDMLVGMAADKKGCVVQLVGDSDKGFEDDKSIQVLVPGGVTISIYKGDICQSSVDAVVFEANEKLCLEGGLTGALLKAAGPALQKQCDHIITTKGTLSPGEAVITNAGDLYCNNVIHAVCPQFDQTDVQTSVSVLRQAVKQSLMLAEENGCRSTALPAIGSGDMSFPLDTSVQTITAAITEHCADLYNANTLKEIHLVANCDKTVQAMKDAVFPDLVCSGKASPQAGFATEKKQHGRVQSGTGPDRVQTKDGLTIILSKGSIQDASTGVIVNTVGKDLRLDSGTVSKAILNAAGPELQNLVQTEASGNKPKKGAVLITEGCNLKSKYVLHAVAPRWDRGNGKSEKVLEDIVAECLEKAEEVQQRSIAFPAIGSGKLGFPADFVASMLLDQIVNFSSKKPKYLQEVVIILHPSDAQTTQAFYDEFSKKFIGFSANLKQPTSPAAASTQPGKGLFSKVTTTNQGHELKVGGVLIQAVTGDITQETTDVIVNSSNVDFSLRSGVSKAVLDAAGPVVDAECKQLGARANKDMIMTQSGNLKSKKVIHIVGRNDVTKIAGSVKAVLQMCAQNQFTSVSFPALGTGQGGVSPSQLADAMLDAVADVVQQDPAMSLQLVRLVVFQAPMLTDFCSSIQKRCSSANLEQPTSPAAASTQPGQGLFSKVTGSIKAALQKYVPNQFTSVSFPALETGLSSKFTTTNQGHELSIGGVLLQAVTGDITQETTDVIVNSSNADFSLRSGVSKAILDAAGPVVDAECKQLGAQANKGMIMTQSGNLKSKKVIHIVGQKDVTKITGSVKAVLQMCAQNHFTSVSFPALGTGQGGVSPSQVADAILDAVADVVQQDPAMSLQLVRLVVFQAPMLTDFGSSMQKRCSTGTQSQVPKTGVKRFESFFSKVTTIKQGHELKVGGVLLQAVTGDITQETTDVIVNSSNADFSLRSGVSKAILDAAGPVVDAECKQLGPQDNKDMIMTQSGNLKSKKVIHIVGRNDVTKIAGSVKAVLQMCAQNQFTSVSFPALGTGQGGVSPCQVADAILDVVADVVQQDPAMSLQLVRLVVFQAPMLTDFCSSMQKRCGTGTQMFSQHGEKEDWKKRNKFSLVEETFDPAMFHLSGASRARVEECKRWLQNLFQQELHFEEIRYEATIHLSAEDRRKLNKLQQSLQVRVKLAGGEPEASITVEGLSRDILKAVGCIQDMLKEARTWRDADLVSNQVEWQYLQGSQYVPFDSLTNLQLEQAVNSQVADATIGIHGQDYKVSFPNGIAVNSQGNQLKIKRIDKQGQETCDLPQHWDPMAADEPWLMVLLQAGTPEHKEVLSLFQATCQKQVSKIERVQNSTLWKNFQILKERKDLINGHQNNEKRLFHGTSQDTIPHINRNGFNRSYAGKNAAVRGNGTYFAVSASYSAGNTYSVPDAQGQKYMYLCRVLTGDFTTGKTGMIAPPPKSNSTENLYDSVTDDPNNPSMFIIFNDIQAYPEYLITFQ